MLNHEESGIVRRRVDADAAGELGAFVELSGKPPAEDFAAVLLRSVRDQRKRLRQIAEEMSALSLPWLLE